MHVFDTRLICIAFVVAAVVGASPRLAGAQPQTDPPVFRAQTELVSVTAVVRDKRGRIIRTLTQDDFVVTDSGTPQSVVDFWSDATAPASVTFLIDGSGSMAAGAASARRISEMLLEHLTPRRDEVALTSFDTRLLRLRDFTGDFDRIRRGLREVDAFGASSVYDAIAGTAGMVAERTGIRRAMVVITDGSDNASAYTPTEVAWIASSIDVPVYIFAVGHSHDIVEAADYARRHRISTPLMDLARATGGDFFYAATPAEQELAVARVVDELRHQYFFAFEPSSIDGLHRLDIRTRNPELKVRSRQWYSTGSDD
jgi:VWFA-related protein